MGASAETTTGSVLVVGGRRRDRPSGGELDGAAASEQAAPRRLAAPAPTRGLELLGEVSGSGYRRAPALVRRADGQTVQLTPLLFHLLEAMDGKRGYRELAAVLGERVGRQATAADVRYLAEAKLRPLGLLRGEDGSEPKAAKANPLLALRLKLVVSNPDMTRRLTAPFAALFQPLVVTGVLIAFAVTTLWVAFEKGLASAAHQALYEPGLLLLVFALTLLSAGFHEVGHAAACRYGGARPGTMGVGLYLVWPAFYTDVTDSYRLGRGGRLRVDLGGLYFNAIFGVGIVAFWTAVHWDALLLVVAAQLFQMVRQLLPVVRFDGYHVLADLTGVPDLFAHIKPTLLGVLPTRRGRGAASALRGWARAVVTLWVLVVVPLLATLLALLVVALPRIAATAWDSLGRQWGALEGNWAQSDAYAVAAGLLSMLTISLPVAGISYLLVRVVRRTGKHAWRATAGHPPLRAGAALAGAILVAAVAWAWWPDGQYRPIDADQRWSLSDVPVLADGGGGASGPIVALASAETSGGSAPTASGETPEQGQWMLVLVPADAPRAGRTAGGAALIGPPPAQDTGRPPRSGWVFPFAPPREPREGDNQAVAVNTEDGATVSDVALALVWVTDGGPVEQRNGAYALASCSGCTTLAVAFQVVLIVGYADVVTPVNAAVAANYACADCVTHALAVQLVATLARLPSDEAKSELARTWAQLEQASESFEMVPLEQAYADLVAAQTAILDVLHRDGAITGETTSLDAAAEGEGAATDAGTTTTTADPSTAPDQTGTTATTTSTTSPETSTTTEEETGTTTTGSEETTTTTSDDGTTTTEEQPDSSAEQETGTTTMP